jgi:diamine N-acetyltransferase
MENDIIYRDVTDLDVDALSALGRDSFVDAFGHLYSAENLNMFLEKAYAPSAIAAEIANPDRLYQIAEADGALFGYCKLNLKTGFGDDIEPGLKRRRALDLSQLYMRGGMTGKGLGDALTRWAIKHARAHGYDDIYLSVYSENFGAQRFYQRHGFTKYADIYFMVGNHRDDEFLYRLALTP